MKRPPRRRAFERLDVDRLDRRIKAGLASGFCQSEIALALGCNKTLVARRVKALREDGIIGPAPVPVVERRRRA